MSSTPSQSDRRIIPFGKIVRQHGFPRAGVSTFKLQLSTPGAVVFEKLDRVFITKKPVTDDVSRRPFDAYRELALVATSSPLGARWQETAAVLLRVREAEGDLKNYEIGLSRDQFPALDTSGVYLCDLIDAEIVDADEKSLGRVRRFFDTGSPSRPSTNIEVVRPDGSAFEFPAALVPTGAEIRAGVWRVPDAGLWAELTQSGAPDDVDSPRGKGDPS